MSWGGQVGHHDILGSLEVGSFMINVLYLERMECKKVLKMERLRQ
jgi:hypothetical protein